MKKLRLLFAILGILMSVTTFTACGGTSSVDYDLSHSSYELMYEKVMDVQSNNAKYLNKVFKLRGKIKSNSSSYHYLSNMDTLNNCCYWSMEVLISDSNTELQYPQSTTKNYYVTGKYKSRKVSGFTSYYLEILDIE